MNVKAQDFYAELRDIVKSSFSCAVGSIMSNRIPIVVPCAPSENPYEERIDLVEQARSLITRLEDRIEANFVSESEEYGKCRRWSALIVRHCVH